MVGTEWRILETQDNLFYEFTMHGLTIKMYRMLTWKKSPFDKDSFDKIYQFWHLGKSLSSFRCCLQETHPTPFADALLPNKRQAISNCHDGSSVTDEYCNNTCIISRNIYITAIIETIQDSSHDDVIKWNHFSRYWPFVRGIHRSPVNFPHKSQGSGALMFSLICAWINCWVNSGKAGDLSRHRARYDVTVMGRSTTGRFLLISGGGVFQIQIQIQNSLLSLIIHW